MTVVPTFQYANYKPHSWENIENHFHNGWGGAYSKMVELVQYIRASGIAARLYGFTSMDSLAITINDPFDPHKETLYIKYDLNSNKWHFEYFARPFQDAEFVRTYPSEKGIEKFDNFIKMIRW